MSEYLEHAEKAEASSAQQKEQNPAIAAQAQTPELSHNWKRVIVTIWIHFFCTETPVQTNTF